MYTRLVARTRATRDSLALINPTYEKVLYKVVFVSTVGHEANCPPADKSRDRHIDAQSSFVVTERGGLSFQKDQKYQKDICWEKLYFAASDIVHSRQANG